MRPRAVVTYIIHKSVFGIPRIEAWEELQYPYDRRWESGRGRVDSDLIKRLEREIHFVSLLIATERKMVFLKRRGSDQLYISFLSSSPLSRSRGEREPTFRTEKTSQETK